MKRNMTRQQIIDKLNIVAFSSYEYSETAREAISLLIEDEKALEKQIPKNPIGIYDENIYHIDDDDYIYEPALFGICPVCNKEVQDGMLFCSFCGQALDWSDAE